MRVCVCVSVCVCPAMAHKLLSGCLDSAGEMTTTDLKSPESDCTGEVYGVNRSGTVTCRVRWNTPQLRMSVFTVSMQS